MKRLAVAAAIACALAIGLASGPVRAAEGCDRAREAWVARCSATGAARITLEACPAGHTVVRVAGPGAPPLAVDITTANSSGFRRVGDVVASPRIDADWGTVPSAWRDGFEQLASCLAHDRFPLAGDTARTFHLPGLPLLVVAIALAIAAPLRRRRGRDQIVPVVALFVASMATARWLVPEAFFHQNGQGPLWIHFALGAASGYGPGYEDLFRFAARHAGGAPEHGVFALQTALWALVPPAMYALARSMGASRWPSVALALSMMLEPALLRAARSESYYAACGSLIALAVAAIAANTRALRVRSVPFVFGCVSAALVLSLAARIHPVSWPAVALAPATILSHRGRLRDRVRVAVAAALVIAVLSLPLALPAMLSTIRGNIGAHWQHAWRWSLPIEGAMAMIVVGMGVVAWAAVRRRARLSAAVRAAPLWVATALAALTMLPAAQWQWHRVAHAALFAPLALASIAAMISSAPATRRSRAFATVLISALALVWSVARFHAETLLTTDVLEARTVIAWRSSFAGAGSVFYLGRAGDVVVELPFFGAEGIGPRSVAWSLEDHSFQLPHGAVWIHSSACSAPAAGTRCDDIERGNRWQPAARVELPARDPLPHVGYRSDTVSCAWGWIP